MRPDWLIAYREERLQPDVIAGLPVQVGMYTVCVPMAVYAVLGSSRPRSVSTTITLAIVVAIAVSPVALANAAHIGQKLRPLADEAKPAIVALDFSMFFNLELAPASDVKSSA